MEIRELGADEVESARQLLIAHGWATRVRDANSFSRLVKASGRNSVVIVSGEIVGSMRAITDGISYGSLSIIVVDAAHCRRGMGTAPVERVTAGSPAATWEISSRAWDLSGRRSPWKEIGRVKNSERVRGSWWHGAEQGSSAPKVRKPRPLRAAHLRFRNDEDAAVVGSSVVGDGKGTAVASFFL